MTSFHDVRTAVRAIRSGAYDFITKQVNPDELEMVLNEALNRKQSAPEIQKKAQVSTFIQGSSLESKKLQNYIELVGPTDMSVIIQGESGTGKEYVANSIHKASKRAERPFVAIDCGSLSRELSARDRKSGV